MRNYKWNARDQRWEPEGLELVVVLGAVALIITVMALGLVLR